MSLNKISPIKIDTYTDCQQHAMFINVAADGTYSYRRRSKFSPHRKYRSIPKKILNWTPHY